MLVDRFLQFDKFLQNPRKHFLGFLFIFTQQVMYNIKEFRDLLILDNAQCSCFGNAPKPDEFFLTKQATTQSKKNIFGEETSKEPNFLRTSFKKSLKRTFVTTVQEPYKKKVEQDCDYRFAQKPTQSFINKLRPEIYQEINNTYSCESLKRYESCQSFQEKATSISIRKNPSNSTAPDKQKLMAMQHFHPKYASDQKIITKIPTTPVKNSLVRHQQKIPATQVKHRKKLSRHVENTSNSVISCKELNSPLSASLIPEVSDLQMIPKSSQSKPYSLSRSASLKMIPQLQYEELASLDLEDSIMQDLIQFKIREKQKHNHKMSLSIQNQQKRHRKERQFDITSPKMMQVSQISRLKKIDDVMQIHSEADSEAGSDSDKQSIVVGRLNQYGSMVEQKKQSASTIQISIQNRIAGIGSLNSTIGHCNFQKSREI